MSLLVRDRMLSHHFSIGAAMPVTDVYELFTLWRFRDLPVVAGGKVVGLLTARTALERLPEPVIAGGDEAPRVTFPGLVAADLMADDDLRTIHVDEPLEDAALALQILRADALAVEDDDGRPCGVLRRADVLPAAETLSLAA